MLCHKFHSVSGGLREIRYNDHIKTQNSVADSTAPVTVVPRTLSQVPVLLVRRIRGLSVPLEFPIKP